jgi:rare lipoprotein A (RlpA)-like double-psi beta-barrel protein
MIARAVGPRARGGGARRARWPFAALAAASLAAGGCSSHARPEVSPSAPQVRVGDHDSGLASWYGPDYHGRMTASGERYNMFDMTAAHRTWPFGTMVRVENLENQRQVTVRINDRGPFTRGRIIDLSYGAARELQISRDGTAKVRIEVVALPASGASQDRRLEDLGDDLVRLVSLAEEGAIGIVHLHVRERGDVKLFHHVGIPIDDVHLPDGDVLAP